jgi:hypothetical protein
MLESLKQNWKPILGVFVLCIFASIIYTRIIKNNEIFEAFDAGQLGMLPSQDRPFQPIPVVVDGQRNYLPGTYFGDELPLDMAKLNAQRPQCSTYEITSPPISSLFNINDMCHTANKKEQLQWNCFYRFDLEKKFLSDPNWATNVFTKDAPIFYRINTNEKNCNICKNS